MRKNLVPCIACGKPSRNRRCPSCSRDYERTRSPNRKAYKDPKYKAMNRYGECVVCGAVGRMTLNHRKPLRHGGTNDISNLELMCHEHNSDWRRY